MQKANSTVCYGMALCHLVSVRDRQPHDVVTADPCRCLTTQLAALLVREDPLANPRVERRAEKERLTLPGPTARALSEWIEARGDRLGPLVHRLDGVEHEP